MIQLAAAAQPEVLLQLAGSLGGLLDVSSLLSFFASLDASSLLVGATLAFKKLWLLGLDVYSLVVGLALGVFKLGAGLALGVYKLGAGLVLGVFKIAKAVALAGADVWSLLVGGAVGVAKGSRAASSALTGRRQRREDGGEEDGEGEGGAMGNGVAPQAPLCWPRLAAPARAAQAPRHAGAARPWQHSRPRGRGTRAHRSWSPYTVRMLEGHDCLMHRYPSHSPAGVRGSWAKWGERLVRGRARPRQRGNPQTSAAHQRCAVSTLPTNPVRPPAHPPARCPSRPQSRA